jgi:hypothetical protein
MLSDLTQQLDKHAETSIIEVLTPEQIESIGGAGVGIWANFLKKILTF